MNNQNIRKIPAVLLTVAILFTTIFSMSIFASAATSFTPRLTAPSTSNKYYYSDMNIFYKYGYGMPNCTAYAYGRAYEILGKQPNLCPYNAEEWYDYNKDNGYYSYGNTPKLGAIACWYYDGGSGHVAVVEKIENGTITFSNSAYGGSTFYTSTAKTSDSNAGGSSWWNFQGYIYIGEFSSSETTSTTSSGYKTGVYKTSVDDYLNMRSGAGTSYSWVASIPDSVSLTVTDVKYAEGYNWGYTSYNGKKGWVALEFCNYVSEIPTTQPTTEPVTTEPTTQPATTEPETTTVQGLGVGDINADGYINIIDATEIQKYLAQLTELTDEQISWCDFDFDGKVSIMDSTAIQKYLAQI